MCISGRVKVQVGLEALNKYCLTMMYFCFQKCGTLVVMIYAIQSLVQAPAKFVPDQGR